MYYCVGCGQEQVDEEEGVCSDECRLDAYGDGDSE